MRGIHFTWQRSCTCKILKLVRNGFCGTGREKQTEHFDEKYGEKANLPDLENKRITNSSARKRLCQTLLSNNIPDTQAIHVTGHKNPQSLNNYRELTNIQKFVMSNILSSAPQLAQVEDSRPLHSGTDDFFSVPSRNTLVNLDLHRSINIQNTRNDSEASFRSVVYGANLYMGAVST